MKLAFNTEGNLFEGVHGCKIAEFENSFVGDFPESETRAKIFRNFIEVLNFLISIGFTDMNIWVDGSYTTNKMNPNDIDFSLVVERDLVDSFTEKQKQVFRKLFFQTNPPDFRDVLHENYDCDVYMIIDVEKYPNDPNYYELMKQKHYWKSLWSHDRLQNVKGFVELEVKGGILL